MATKNMDTEGNNPEEKQITLSVAITKQWEAVGKLHKLKTDLAIATFLLQLWKKTDGGSYGLARCVACQKPLSAALCSQCAVSSTDGNSDTLAATAESSLVVKHEKRDGGSDDVDDNLIIHFEDIAVQTDQQVGEESKVEPTGISLDVKSKRVVGRRRGRPPKVKLNVQNVKQEHGTAVISRPDVPPVLQVSHRKFARSTLPSADSDAQGDPKTKRQTSPEIQTKSCEVSLYRVNVTTRTSSKNQNWPANKNKKTSKRVQKIKEDSDFEIVNDSDYEIGNDIDENYSSAESSDEKRKGSSQKGKKRKTGDEEETREDVEKEERSDGVEQDEKGQRGRKKGGGRRKIGVFPCDDCDSVFKEADLLKSHKLIHTQDHGKNWDYHCDQCTRSFRQKDGLVAHMRTHTGLSLFVCAICDLRFPLTRQLKRHVWTQHSEAASTAACYKCAHCDGTFQEERKLYRHVYRLEKRFQCEVCSKVFRDDHGLLIHIRGHTNERPYTCSECGLTFRQQGELNKHMQRHRGERNYKCHLCSAAYYASSHLKMHLAGHKGEKPYLCQLCGAAYTNSASLKTHMRWHTGERPFKCQVCEKDFARPNSFRQHKLTHLDVRPYSCSICPWTFSAKCTLNRHHRLKHSGKEKTRMRHSCGGVLGVADGGSSTGVSVDTADVGDGSGTVGAHNSITFKSPSKGFKLSDNAFRSGLDVVGSRLDVVGSRLDVVGSRLDVVGSRLDAASRCGLDGS